MILLHVKVGEALGQKTWLRPSFEISVLSASVSSLPGARAFHPVPRIVCQEFAGGWGAVVEGRAHDSIFNSSVFY